MASIALNVTGNAIANGAIKGAVSGVVTQGIGVATGLQSHFDWAGVAAAGVMGGVMAGVGDALNLKPGVFNFDNGVRQLAASMAGGIAAAAARSLITGTDFGDNINAMLPGIIGGTVGSMAAGGLQQQMSDSSNGNNPNSLEEIVVTAQRRSLNETQNSAPLAAPAATALEEVTVTTQKINLDLNLVTAAFAPASSATPRSMSVKQAGAMYSHLASLTIDKLFGSQESAAGAPMNIGEVLGKDVENIARLSPALMNDLKILEDAHYIIQVGKAGDGTFTDLNKHIIFIDANDLSNPLTVVQSLAHEVGHALDLSPIDSSTREADIRSRLNGEGAATLENIAVQREIMGNGGPNIGIAGDPENHGEYNKVFDQFAKDGNVDQAKSRIGEIYGNGEHASGPDNLMYRDYYGQQYDKGYR